MDGNTKNGMKLKDLSLQERGLFTWIRGATFTARMEIHLQEGRMTVSKIYMGTIASFTAPITTPLDNDELNILAVIRTWKFGCVVIDSEHGKGKLNSNLSYMTINFGKEFNIDKYSGTVRMN